MVGSKEKAETVSQFAYVKCIHNKVNSPTGNISPEIMENVTSNIIQSICKKTLRKSLTF